MFRKSIETLKFAQRVSRGDLWISNDTTCIWFVLLGKSGLVGKTHNMVFVTLGTTHTRSENGKWYWYRSKTSENALGGHLSTLVIEGGKGKWTDNPLDWPSDLFPNKVGEIMGIICEWRKLLGAISGIESINSFPKTHVESDIWTHEPARNSSVFPIWRKGRKRHRRREKRKKAIAYPEKRDARIIHFEWENWEKGRRDMCQTRKYPHRRRDGMCPSLDTSGEIEIVYFHVRKTERLRQTRTRGALEEK